MPFTIQAAPARPPVPSPGTPKRRALTEQERIMLRNQSQWAHGSAQKLADAIRKCKLIAEAIPERFNHHDRLLLLTRRGASCGVLARTAGSDDHWVLTLRDGRAVEIDEAHATVAVAMADRMWSNGWFGDPQ